MKRTICGLVGIVVILGMVSAIIPAAGTEPPAPSLHVLEFGTIAPENSYWGDIATQTAREIERKTGGGVKIRWYFGAIMGDEPEMVEKIRQESLQGAVFTLLGAGEIAREIYIFSLPFLFHGYDEADYVLAKMRSTIDKIFLENGFVNLGLVDIGFVRLFSRVPIRNEKDFGNIIGWSWSGEPLVIDTYRLLGVERFTPVKIPEVFSSLEAETVNAVFGTCYSTVGFQWHTRLKYMSAETISFSPGAILMSRNSFEALRPEHQRIVMETCRDYIPRLQELIRRDENKVCRSLSASHLEELAFDPEYLAGLRRKSRGVYYSFVDRYFPRWLLAGTLNLLQQYRIEKKSGALPIGTTP